MGNQTKSNQTITIKIREDRSSKSPSFMRSVTSREGVDVGHLLHLPASQLVHQLDLHEQILLSLVSGHVVAEARGADSLY